MTQIRVNPPSVAAYGETAEGLFKGISTELSSLVDNALTVPFEGRHGAEFKAAVGKLAVDFAQETHRSMLAMARMVHAATQSIATSLGGNVLTINITAPDLAPPTTSFDQLVDVETTKLTGFGDTVTAHFTSVRTKLGEHLAALNGTDWQGDAKLSVAKSVGTATETAQGLCDTALGKINEQITAQVTATETADKAVY